MSPSNLAKAIPSKQFQNDKAAQLDRNIGIIIGHLRRADGLSITDLANFTGSAEWEVARIEAGKQSPSLAFLMKVAKQLSIDAGEMISAAEILAKEKE